MTLTMIWGVILGGTKYPDISVPIIILMRSQNGRAGRHLIDF